MNTIANPSEKTDTVVLYAKTSTEIVRNFKLIKFSYSVVHEVGNEKTMNSVVFCTTHGIIHC